MSEDRYPYSPLFQQRILALLIQDPSVYRRYWGVWDSSYFDDTKLQSVANPLFSYFDKHSEGMDRETLRNVVLLRYEHSSESFQGELLEVVDDLFDTEVPNKDYLQSMVVEWARDQALENAVLAAADALNKGQRDKVKSSIDAALKVGEDLNRMGFVLNKETKNVSKLVLEKKKNSVPTGFTDLDLLLDSKGVAGGEMLVYVGPPKGFKSGILLNSCIPALMAPYGLKVTYISLELSEIKLLERFAYRVAKLDGEYMTENPEEFDRRFEERLEKVFSGQLAIRQYPMRTASADDFRAYLDLLDSKGHVTDLLVVDYGNIMKPLSQYSRSRDDIAVGSNFEAIRAIATERDIPTLTASRSNRESLKSKDIRMEHIAGSMEIAASCDYCVAIIKNEDLDKEHRIIQKLLLNRNEEANVLIDNRVDYPCYHIWNEGIIENYGDDEEEEDKKSSSSRRRERRAESALEERQERAKKTSRGQLDPALKKKIQGIVKRT